MPCSSDGCRCHQWPILRARRYSCDDISKAPWDNRTGDENLITLRRIGTLIYDDVIGGDVTWEYIFSLHLLTFNDRMGCVHVILSGGCGPLNLSGPRNNTPLIEVWKSDYWEVFVPTLLSFPVSKKFWEEKKRKILQLNFPLLELLEILY